MSNHEININLKVRNVIISTSIYPFYLLLMLSYSVSLHIPRGHPYFEFCFPSFLAFLKNSVITYVYVSVTHFNFVYVLEQSCMGVRRVIFQNLIIPFSIIIRLVLIYIHINVWSYGPFIAVFNITLYKWITMNFLFLNFWLLKTVMELTSFFLLLVSIIPWP